MGDATVEPSSAARTAARHLRDYYVALVQEGFTERQALEIVIQLLRGLRVVWLPALLVSAHERLLDVPAQVRNRASAVMRKRA